MGKKLKDLPEKENSQGWKDGGNVIECISQLRSEEGPDLN